jgi:long-chain acyl-CoA synthetase
MPGCEVRIELDGEILVRSEMMFSGYYKEPLKTAEVMRDGWLLTGDIGAQDADGFLKITGRKKELIVLSTGKNVAPALVENMLKEHHLVSHAYVHGDGRSYLVALVTLNPLEAEEHARARGIAYESFEGLAASAEMRDLVASIVESANRRVSSSESVRRFRILDRDFRPDLDEVTPTLKLKRDVVARNFEDVLQSLYA